MKGVSVLFFLGICLTGAIAQFLNNKPFPTYSLENMPTTDFSCREKILGGYYADAETNCQMFHICVKVAGVGIQDFRFLCPNGTAFDQDHQICAEWGDIDCDASTLYYASDNFDLYRIGSGFESKAQKYGEDEETFALQRAETGDARINREQQSNTVNQKKEVPYFSTRKQKAFKNYENSDSNSNNNDKDIFKGSSSSNFYNNRNNGKETDADYDDNVNVNQNTDYSGKRKVVKNKIRRPVQNNNYNQDNNNRNQNTGDYNRNQNDNYNTNQYNENNRKENHDNNRNRNLDYNRNSNGNTNQNLQKEPTTKRPIPARNTVLQNNFVGSSYVPTTARTTSTTLNADQYTTAIHNYRTRNGQRQRQYTETDSPVYTVSTPAPFKGSQQYNQPPSRQSNNGRYYSTTQAPPQRRTENYPQSKSVSPLNYDVSKVKKTGTTAAQAYNTQYDTPRVGQSSTTASEPFSTQYDVSKTTARQSFGTQYDVPRTSSAATQTYNTQYDTPRVKETASSAAYDVPKTGSTPSQIYNTQFDSSKLRQTATTAAQINYNTNYDVPKSKQSSSPQTKFAITTTQYESTKVKNTDNYPVNNPKYNEFEKKPTTPFKQTENYPSTLSPKPFSLNNFPSTFAPRTNKAYSQIAHQTINYNKNSESTGASAQTSSGFVQQSSTVRSTPFTQYTPTVPRISSTTPASRSVRFDETQYDDGSYSTRRDYDDKREDEFLRTAHSQNIAASRNELARTPKVQPSTAQAQTPRSFSTSSRATEAPRTGAKAAEQARSTTKAADFGAKNAKDVSYDYAYYDSHTDSGEADYDIETDIKKATVKN